MSDIITQRIELGLDPSSQQEIRNEEAIQDMIIQLKRKVLQNRKTENRLFERIQEIESNSADSTTHELRINLAEVIARQEELYSRVARNITILTRMECKSHEEAKALVIIAIEDIGDFDVVIRYEITQRVLGKIKKEEMGGSWDRHQVQEGIPEAK